MSLHVPAKIHPSVPHEHDLRMSWLSVVLVPVAFALAMFAGEGLISVMGYDPSTQSVPLGTALLAGIPALVILLAPGAAAVFYGHRACRAGRKAARVPAWIGGGLAVALFAVNLAGFIAGW